MPEEIIPQFEHQALEADMDRLAGEVMKARENPELSSVAGQEILKQAIRTVHFTHQSAVPQPDGPNSSLPQYADSAPPETKLEIEYLIDLALHSGLAKASDASKHAPPFVLDAFHDALAGKLYPEFKRRGLLP